MVGTAANTAAAVVQYGMMFYISVMNQNVANLVYTPFDFMVGKI